MRKQIDAPELPSDVQDFPIDWVAWSTFLTAALFILRLFLLWWLDRRKARLLLRNVSVNVASSQLPAHGRLSLLRQKLSNLSADQQAEAGELSQLLRKECGRRLQRDCSSSTDAQLLALDDGAFSKSNHLAPLLQFCSSIQFAQARPNLEMWKQSLNAAGDWLAECTEVRS